MIFSLENSADFSLDAIPIFFLKISSDDNFTKAFEKPTTSLAGMRNPVFPSSIISAGPCGQSKLMTGKPQFIASIMTNPNPSYLEGNKNMELFKNSFCTLFVYVVLG